MANLLNRALTNGFAFARRTVRAILEYAIEGYGRCGCAEAGVDPPPEGVHGDAAAAAHDPITLQIPDDESR